MTIINSVKHIGIMGTAYFVSTSYSYAIEAHTSDETQAHVEGHIDNAMEHASSAEHASSGGLPQFDPTWFASQVFWLAVCFGILYVVFAKKTLPNISSTIDRRRTQIESDIETTDELTGEAEDVLSAYQTKLKESRGNARTVIMDAEKSIRDNEEKAHNEFLEMTEGAISKAEASINEAKDKASKDIEKIAGEIAIETAKKLLNQDIDSSNVESIISKISKDGKTSSKSKTAKKAA